MRPSTNKLPDLLDRLVLVGADVLDGPHLLSNRNRIGQNLGDDRKKPLDSLRLVDEDDGQRCFIGPMPHRWLVLMASTKALKGGEDGSPRHSSSDGGSEEFIDLGPSVTDVWLG